MTIATENNNASFNKTGGLHARVEIPYHELLIVGKRPSQDNFPARIWSTLKHRLSLIEELHPVKDQSSGDKRISGRLKRGAVNKGPIVFDGFLHLIDCLSPMAKGEVYRLLLERRFLVPFIVPKVNHEFYCEAPCLRYVDTMVSNEGISIAANLMMDTSCCRIAVISERPASSSCTSDWLKNIFHVQSLHSLDVDNKRNVTQLGCAAELGWGFLKDRSKYMPVMVLHVIGNYKPLQHFIDAFATGLVVDAGNGTCDATIPKGSILKWTYSEYEEVDEINTSDTKTIILQCTNTSAYEEITEYLLELEPCSYQSCLELVEKCGLLYDSLLGSKNALKVCQTIDFSTLRIDGLQLQKNFAIEGQLRTTLQRETDDVELSKLEEQIEAIQEQNRELAIYTTQNPLVTYFVEILQLASFSAREMAIINLEHYLSLSCSVLSTQARKEYRLARNIFSSNPDKNNEEACFKALEHWSLMVTGTEHLWRELSHFFVADPAYYSHYPRLAAQHLLDGFPIELMDGDAAMVNVVWIKAILNQLSDALPNARIFVLSIMGVQSAGKSTLLNYMFGVRFRTSVSRCTRGVNIQLLKCEGRSEYEYILLLDTEGIRSPEHIGEGDSVWRDNRMATLAILPADATIILTKGEATTTISEILPIVLSVFLDSELAESISGQLASKFYFVFNQIDVSQSTNMEIIVNTLLENLRINAEKIQAIRANNMTNISVESTPSKPSTRHLNNFQVNIEDERVSDVRFLGTIKGSIEPPFDTPHEDFGKRLLQFRDYIHDRATQRNENGHQWKARSITELNIYLDLVWSCINKSNFQLNFIAAHERMLYEILIQTIANLKQEMAKVYTEALDQVLQIICEDEANKVVLEENPRKYEYCMRNIVQEAIVQLDMRARQTIEEPKVAKWRQDQLIRWEKHCQSQEDHAIKMVQEKVVQVFHYGAQVAMYKQQLQNLIKNRVTQGYFNLDKDFPKLFQTILYKIEQAHPPLSHDISIQIDKIFFESELLKPHECQMIKSGPPKCTKFSWNKLVEKSLSLFLREKAFDEKDAERKVVESVEKTLISTTRFSGDIVMECILQTRWMLFQQDIPNSLLDICMYKLYKTVHEQMQRIQSKWERDHGIISKFEQCKESMKEFAKNLSQGFQAEELFVKTIGNWIKEYFSSTVAQHLVYEIAVELKQQKWVINATAMQAQLDKSLLNHLKADRKESILNALFEPVTHRNQVLSEIILAQIRLKKDYIKCKILSILKEAIVQSAKSTQLVKNYRNSRFIFYLRRQLLRKLSLSGTSDLVVNLPDIDESVMNCDASWSQVFESTQKSSVLSRILKLLESKELKADKFASQQVVAKVLQNIFDVSFGANDGIVPRCGEPCPRCQCPCIKAHNHISNPDDRHDTFHQPLGLVGGSWKTSHELVEFSCVSAVRQNCFMVMYKDGKEKKYAYREFDKYFPTWSMPSIQQPLPLREYIFAHCQEELATKYSREKCSKVPAKYFSHDLDDIERQLNRLLDDPSNTIE